MEYRLKYGQEQVHIVLPTNSPIEILQPARAESTANESEIIQAALNTPVASSPLEKIVRKGETTCIVVPDRTRECRTAVYLPILLQRLNECGIENQDLTILFANGTHRKNTRREQQDILGEAIVKRIPLIEHDCHDQTSLVHLGETCFGTPVFINKKLIRAERVILTGGVLHHYFAGFGGGPKLVNPGCAGYQTILHNHRFTIHPIFPTLHPGCNDGNIQDNPVHADIRDSLKFVHVDFALNVVTGADGNIQAAVSGEPFTAHTLACQATHQRHTLPLKCPADLVIASAGGYPKDLNLIQVHKSIHHAFAAVRAGGVIILLAQCHDGIGSKSFEVWFEGDPDLPTLHQRLLTDFKINGNTALALKLKTSQVKIILISELEAVLVQKFGMIPASSFAAAFEIARRFLPEAFKTIILPDAATYLPVADEAFYLADSAWKKSLIEKALDFVKERLGADRTGHDFWHAWRVWRLAQRIQAREGGNPLIIEIAALLHDVVDWKHMDVTDRTQQELVKDWLMLQRLPRPLIEAILEIIENLSFKGAGVPTPLQTLEGQIVQDADRLDAIGAIGIARTFAYGGSKQRPFHTPEASPELHQTEAAYRQSRSSSINHFYEKLLLVFERLNTPTAREIGSSRDQFLRTFLARFLKEWQGEE
ncbi:nickel-dependent lactate racemase [candidate division KSB1 bacterium]|nr:nickel-dependent lactate racemase [candidate division KSB1 bacterium]